MVRAFLSLHGRPCEDVNNLDVKAFWLDRCISRRMDKRFIIALPLLCMLCVGLVGDRRVSATEPALDLVVVDIAPTHKIQTIHPLRAIGSTVDKEDAGSIPELYSKSNVRAMLDSGLGWLSYRLYTELSDQDWHWNPSGTFSAHNAGYWISSASTQSPSVTDSFGYRLPHRGNTTDQGNNESYSRIDDGDLNTYWKSDPYLTHLFTGEPDELHPQWVVIDLQQSRAINAMEIDWANPYATNYSLQFWTGDDAIGDPGTAQWLPVALAKQSRLLSAANRLGPSELLRFRTSVTARFIRLLMTRSSQTCDTHGAADKRNCAGYAIAEIRLGRIDSTGVMADDIYHAPCGGDKPRSKACGVRQTPTYVSSVDPWHSSDDRVRNQEQPGLDLIARSGLTRGLPAMYPVPMLYSTPENAVAEVRYMRSRGYPISYIELGEEPDGQYVAPEDDAALYVQWARALHHYDPSLKLGGPVFSGVNSDLLTWPDKDGNVSWLNRFLNYLKAHNAMGELAFMSFEHYPDDNGCLHGVDLQYNLLVEPSRVKGVVNAWHSDGVPLTTPLYITEANFSSVNHSQVPMQIEGALWQADYMASALASGVTGVVYYQYEPVALTRNDGCPSDWGNLTMFVADTHAHIRANAAQFYAVQMLTQQWLQPGDAPHDLYPAATNVTQSGYPLMTAYAVHRPDGLWSVMIVNKDTKERDVMVEFRNSDVGGTQVFANKVTRVSFGSAQYVWHPHGAQSMPLPDNPPMKDELQGGPPSTTYAIPARSITVLRGAILPAPIYRKTL